MNGMPMVALGIYLKASLFIAFVLTSPLIMLEAWGFVSLGFTNQERRKLLLYIPSAIGLFLLGASFGYFFLFPMMLRFMFSFAQQLGVTESYGIIQYFNMLFDFIWPVGVLFELPIVIMFLTSIGLITPSSMKKFRRIAYFAIIVIASVITPPDVISDVLVSVPLLALYELSIWLSGHVYGRSLQIKKHNVEFWSKQKVEG